MKQGIRPGICLLISAALAGCFHTAAFDVYARNWTPSTVQVILSLRADDSAGREIFNHSFTAVPGNASDAIRLVVDSGSYIAAAWTENLTPSRKVDLGSGVRSLQVLVEHEPSRLIIGLSQV